MLEETGEPKVLRPESCAEIKRRLGNMPLLPILLFQVAHESDEYVC